MSHKGYTILLLSCLAAFNVLGLIVTTLYPIFTVGDEVSIALVLNLILLSISIVMTRVTVKMGFSLALLSGMVGVFISLSGIIGLSMGEFHPPLGYFEIFGAVISVVLIAVSVNANKSWETTEI